eukprot:scaffold330020_cov41-Prasinocladus_malaysianus.AAC.1
MQQQRFSIEDTNTGSKDNKNVVRSAGHRRRRTAVPSYRTGTVAAHKLSDSPRTSSRQRTSTCRIPYTRDDIVVRLRRCPCIRGTRTVPGSGTMLFSSDTLLSGQGELRSFHHHPPCRSSHCLRGATSMIKLGNHQPVIDSTKPILSTNAHTETKRRRKKKK